MRILLQRVKKASVNINDTIFSSIDNGLLLFIGITETDTVTDIDLLVNKLIHLRVFNDENHKINHSLLETGYAVLSVSQYSLYADYKKGRRPSFTKNASVEKAKTLYNQFNETLNHYVPVKTGVFQADMQITLVNDGPFTLLLDSQELR